MVGNSVARAASGGVLIHAGKNNWIENNLLIDCHYGLRPQEYISSWEFWKSMAGFMTGNHFIQNLVYSHLPEAQIMNLYNWSDRTLARWQDLGYDRHSLCAFPHFVDPGHDDFRLAP